MTDQSKKHTVKSMSVTEFRAEGYLQELNRQFLHPLGLALEVSINDDGTESLGRIWDSRDDPEEIVFGPNTIDPTKAGHITQLTHERIKHRLAALGFWTQPLDLSDYENSDIL